MTDVIHQPGEPVGDEQRCARCGKLLLRRKRQPDGRYGWFDVAGRFHDATMGWWSTRHNVKEYAPEWGFASGGRSVTDEPATCQEPRK